MKHKDMDKRQREELSNSLAKFTIRDIEIFSEEPYIELSNGIIIYIEDVEL